MGGRLADWWCHCNRSETSRRSCPTFVPALWLPGLISHGSVRGPRAGARPFSRSLSSARVVPSSSCRPSAPGGTLYADFTGTLGATGALTKWGSSFSECGCFTFWLFTESFPSANKYAGISPTLEKCLLLTKLPRTAISWSFASFYIQTPPKGCPFLLTPVSSLSPYTHFQETSAFTTPSERLIEGTAGPVLSHLWVVIRAGSPRGKGQASAPRGLALFTWLPCCAPSAFLSPHWWLLLSVLFSPLSPNSRCPAAQS